MSARLSRLKAARERGSHSWREWEALIDLCGGRCVRCRAQFIRVKQSGEYQRPERDLDAMHWERLTKDHIQPISAGGSDGIENIQPLCLACNTSKHAGYTRDWRPPEWQDALAEALRDGWQRPVEYCVGCPPDCDDCAGAPWVWEQRP